MVLHFHARPNFRFHYFHHPYQIMVLLNIGFHDGFFFFDKNCDFG